MIARVVWRLSIIGACLWLVLGLAAIGNAAGAERDIGMVILGTAAGALAILAVGRGLAWAFEAPPERDEPPQ